VVFGHAGAFPAVIHDTDLDGTNGFIIGGNDVSVSAAGDVNGDGIGDMLVGVRPFGSSNTSYIIYGREPDAAVNRTGTDASQTLAGGEFNDTLSALGGNDKLYGNGGNDTLDGGAGQDLLIGGAGDDTLIGGAGADIMNGGAGENTASYASSANAIHVELGIGAGFGGDAQGDALANIQELIGSAFEDVLVGDANLNRLFGGNGNDWLFGVGGPDLLDGGAGQDKVWYDTSSAAVTVDLMAGFGTGGDAQGDLYGSIEDVVGSNFSDLLSGDGNANQLIGLGGNDILRGNGGTDYVDGGAGENWAYYDLSSAAVSINLATGAASGGDAQGDILANIQDLVGSQSGDTLVGDGGGNQLFGLGGNDSLTGGGGADNLDGGAGEDTAMYDTSSGAIQINLAVGQGLAGDAQGDVLTNIEDVVGSNFSDVLTGDANANTLSGGGGNDWLIGLGGPDHLDGGAGQDKAWYDASAAAVTVDLAAGTGAGGDAQGDVLTSIEDVVGSEFSDVLTGTAASNQLIGLGGNDALRGGGGADLLDGGAGENWAYYDGSSSNVNINLAAGTASGGDAQGDILVNIQDVVGSQAIVGDRLTGDARPNQLFALGGDDFLDGGGGADILSGGVGNDTFVFRPGEANGDTVTDFTHGAFGQADRLNFDAYGAFNRDWTFTQIDSTHWQVNYNGGTSHDVITFSNAPAIDFQDYVLLPG
jgi:Ca2+-binding RTX toxin-like protein